MVQGPPLHDRQRGREREEASHTRGAPPPQPWPACGRAHLHPEAGEADQAKGEAAAPDHPRGGEGVHRGDHRSEPHLQSQGQEVKKMLSTF